MCAYGGGSMPSSSIAWTIFCSAQYCATFFCYVWYNTFMPRITDPGELEHIRRVYVEPSRVERYDIDDEERARRHLKKIKNSKPQAE